MDIKNLLCPHVTDQVMLEKNNYLYNSCYSSPSSLSSSPSSSYASPLPILASPPNSPSMKQQRQQRRVTTQTRTPWSSEEDFLLQKGYSQGLSWAMISSTYLPHRSRGCCWGRFKTLQAKALEQREWSDPEDRLLLLAVKKHAKLFKHAWKSVADDMGQRTWRECEIRSFKLGNMVRKRQHPQHLQHLRHHQHTSSI
ncbi:uncharacterized protein BX664DRAFT_319023 [Halteromyces radiatus]|uniref:uncharacterized protein n=1 Tax=Halteromyces radiatus TaxID=101107 RepID=UPI00221F94AF|nr:uncharacterized protein BX664DRAFT_319023 [Halteromyces radiatus]KAI8098558.1 hypothetical protein BX664DRAFT_319023 [Halteromyces radiatus]